MASPEEQVVNIPMSIVKELAQTTPERKYDNEGPDYWHCPVCGACANDTNKKGVWVENQVEHNTTCAAEWARNTLRKMEADARAARTRIRVEEFCELLKKELGQNEKVEVLEDINVRVENTAGWVLFSLKNFYDHGDKKNDIQLNISKPNSYTDIKALTTYMEDSIVLSRCVLMAAKLFELGTESK